MKRLRIIITIPFVLMACLSFAQQDKTAQPFTIGETISLFSNTLQEERTLNIYLPRGYESGSEKVYPIIYLLDGSADEDFIHVAGAVQFCSFSWINIIPESIVVGIANVDRKRDFTFPTSNKKDKLEFPTTGGSEKFIEFLENELQPYITANYKVSQERTIIGQSLGGLLTAEILLKKPALFDNYIIVSPSMWWDDESLLNYEIQKPTTAKNIYVAVGSEGPTMETGAIKLYYKLWTEYKTAGTIFYNFLENQNHGDALHLAIYDAFEKLFAEKKSDN